MRFFLFLLAAAFLVPFILTISFLVAFFSGALFNQLTYYMTSWRRNYLHKKGNRVKVKDSQEILHLFGYVVLLKINCLVSELK